MWADYERNKYLVAEKLEEIKIKYKVSKVKVSCRFIIISNLGVIPKETERDICSLIDSDKKEMVL
jgi:hypothetical protein